MAQLEEALELYFEESSQMERERQDALAEKAEAVRRRAEWNLDRQMARKEAALAHKHRVKTARIVGKEGIASDDLPFVMGRGLLREDKMRSCGEADFRSLMSSLRVLDRRLTRELADIAVSQSDLANINGREGEGGRGYLPRRHKYDHLLDTVSKEIEAAKRARTANRDQVDDGDAITAPGEIDRRIHTSFKSGSQIEEEEIHKVGSEEEEEEDSVARWVSASTEWGSLDEFVLSVLRTAVRDLQADQH